MHRIKLFTLIVLFILALLVLGCAHNVTFVDFTDGTTFVGHFYYPHEFSRRITVTTPDGEVFEGKYSSMLNESIGAGSLFYGGRIATMTAVGIGGPGHAYAILIGNTGTVMEAIVTFNLSNHGFGEARTNKGGQYKIIF